MGLKGSARREGEYLISSRGLESGSCLDENGLGKSFDFKGEQPTTFSKCL